MFLIKIYEFTNVFFLKRDMYESLTIDIIIMANAYGGARRFLRRYD